MRNIQQCISTKATKTATATLTLLLTMGVLCEPSFATANDPADVIPPGQEETLAHMLGKGATLPGGCTFAAGEVQHTIVEATYACSSGAVVVELTHPDIAPPGSQETDRFALTITKGTPPDGFTDALLSDIRAGEGAFEWLHVAPETSAETASLTWLIGAALALVGALVWILRRRISRR